MHCEPMHREHKKDRKNLPRTEICPEPLWFGAFLRPVNETSKGANQHETGKDIGNAGS